MSGHRRGKLPDGGTQERRSLARAASWRSRIASASSSEQVYDVASDWLRAVAARIPNTEDRTRVLNDAARFLAGQADEIARAT